MAARILRGSGRKNFNGKHINTSKFLQPLLTLRHFGFISQTQTMSIHHHCWNSLPTRYSDQLLTTLVFRFSNTIDKLIIDFLKENFIMFLLYNCQNSLNACQKLKFTTFSGEKGLSAEALVIYSL